MREEGRKEEGGGEEEGGVDDGQTMRPFLFSCQIKKINVFFCFWFCLFPVDWKLEVTTPGLPFDAVPGP